MLLVLQAENLSLGCPLTRLTPQSPDLTLAFGLSAFYRDPLPFG